MSNLPAKYDHLPPEAKQELAAALNKMQEVEGHVISDLQAALNLIAAYQRHLSMFNSPDPSYVEARNLLTKYGMAVGATPPANYRIFYDGKDITEHPDSVEGLVVETQEVGENERRSIGPGLGTDRPSGDQGVDVSDSGGTSIS